MANYTYIGDSNPDGVVVGVATTNKVAFYGTVPITQRAGYATSLVATASSADVTTNLKAAVIEIQNTLSALGIWPPQA